MLYYHLPCCCKHKNLHNGLSRMSAEHFYKLHSNNKRQRICKKFRKEIHIHTEDFSARHITDQPDTDQCDHSQNHNRQQNFHITRNMIDHFIKPFPYGMIHFLFHFLSLSFSGISGYSSDHIRLLPASSHTGQYF